MDKKLTPKDRNKKWNMEVDDQVSIVKDVALWLKDECEKGKDFAWSDKRRATLARHYLELAVVEMKDMEYYHSTRERSLDLTEGNQINSPSR
jgi:hypothetical protein